MYYLESDIWKERKEELQQTMLSQMTSEEEKESHIFNRDDWIPHPEQRDTPPNIQLYSVLVGGLPSKPKEVVPSEDLEAAVAADAKAAIDWQLSVTAAFFDACVPNQPGCKFLEGRHDLFLGGCVFLLLKLFQPLQSRPVWQP